MSERAPVCKVDELPNGRRKHIEVDDIDIIVVNCDGTFLAIEDVCSHDGSPLDDGPLDCAAGTIECPRHGSLFDLRTGRPKTLPAYMPVETFEVEVEDGTIFVTVD
jgi:3-phenylpropionate/trans-cinnamate dioxygenase ferredoxin subunit